MTAPKWTRPQPATGPMHVLTAAGRPWTIWQLARQALGDAEMAGDDEYAARILCETAWLLVAHHDKWNRVRPPLGVPRHDRSEAA